MTRWLRFGRSLRFRDRRQPARKLDKLGRRLVRRRTGRRELFLVLFLVSLPSRPFAGKLGHQPIDLTLERLVVLAQGIQSRLNAWLAHRCGTAVDRVLNGRAQYFRRHRHTGQTVIADLAAPMPADRSRPVNQPARALAA